MLTKNRFILRENLTTLAASEIKNAVRVELDDGSRYLTSNIDSGDGIPLSSGNYANPISQPDKPNNQTGAAYTISSADKGKTVWMNSAAANTVTIPLSLFTINDLVMIMQEGDGETTITADAGVLLNGVDGGSVAIGARYSGATIVKRASNSFVITGNIGEVA